MLECVINVSEGRDVRAIRAIAAAAGPSLLDVHSDRHHNRSVLTLAGPGVVAAARAVAAAAVERLDIARHEGVHPRIGVVDVVPFVPLRGSAMSDAIAARDAFAEWLTTTLAVPCLTYGPERSLPEVRRLAVERPHPTAGACAVGARPLLVAYNVWLDDDATVATARSIAAAVRSPYVRALGFDVGGRAQVSCNLIAPGTYGPAALVDDVARRAVVAGTELVGLVPRAVLDAIERGRWASLDLHPSRTIEARLEQAGLDGGSA